MTQTVTSAQVAIATIEDPAELAHLAQLAAAKAEKILSSRSDSDRSKK